MVQHHLTDDVSDPALLFFPPLHVCVFLIRNTRQRKIQKKNTITHSPLECTHVRGQTALQPISPYQGEMGGPPKATTSGVGRADVTFFFFRQGYNRPCLWMSSGNVVGVQKNMSCHMRSCDFPNFLLL